MNCEELPKFVNDDVVKKLSDWMKKSLATHNDKGEIDLEKMIHNATYNMGDVGIEAAGWLFQERLKLEDMEAKYREARAIQFDDMMNKRVNYEKSKENINLILDGNANLNQLKSKINKQKNYIKFLEDYQEQIKFYASNTKEVVKLHEILVESGKLV